MGKKRKKKSDPLKCTSSTRTSWDGKPIRCRRCAGCRRAREKSKKERLAAAEAAFKAGKKRGSRTRMRKKLGLRSTARDFVDVLKYEGKTISLRGSFPSHIKKMLDSAQELINLQRHCNIECLVEFRSKLPWAPTHWMWHGTKGEHLYSISEKGLLVSRAALGLLGRGIYTTPAVEKAWNYTGWRHEAKVLLLVAQRIVDPVQIDGTLFGKGREVQDLVRDLDADTAWVPKGPYQEAWSGYIRNTEYCTYNQDNVCARYALVVRNRAYRPPLTSDPYFTHWG